MEFVAYLATPRRAGLNVGAIFFTEGGVIIMARQWPMLQDSYTLTSGFGPRWGTHHSGLDFGAPDGTPFYACAGGTVQYIGSAQGYGQWIVIDHPDSEGGGCTEYGHMWDAFATGLKVGDWVHAGQLIGYVGSNGESTGPHLHLGVHEYDYSSRLVDPEEWLRGCPHPLPYNTVPNNVTGTIFGVDVSEHQDGMSLVAAANEGIDFAIIRTSDGTYQDRTYRSHVDDARAAGLVSAAYCYLRNPNEGTTIQQQVGAALEVMGDSHRLPVWLDCETDAGLTEDHIWEAKRLFEMMGVRVPGVYTYVPWWEQRIHGGEPDSHRFGAMWVAAYGDNPHGAPRLLYGGNSHPQWDYPLGNQKPAIWQFGSNARVAGYDVDINAYRGTRAELEHLFTGGMPAPMTKDEGESQMLRWILDQLVGPEWEGDKPKFSGWKQTEGKTLTDYIADKLRLLPEIARTVATLPERLDRIEKLLTAGSDNQPSGEAPKPSQKEAE